MQLRSTYASGHPDGRRRTWWENSRSWIALLVLAVTCPACGAGDDDGLPDSFMRLSIDKSDPERLLRTYLGGYVAPEPSDPFEAGVLHDRGGRLFVDMESLRRYQPAAAIHLTDVDGNGRIDWEEFESFVHSTYHTVRSAPATLDDLLRQVSFDPTDPNWMRVDVNGVMTTARRRVYVRESAIRDALGHYNERDRRIIYPIATTFIGEHRVDGEVVETTVMRKREDGFWDYFVYGADGSLAEGTTTPPRELASPVQCVGCHFGDRLFEPEKSFPARARPGPHGPRQVYVDEELRDAEVVRFFDEHRRRSDTVLGLYTTLYVSKLRAERREGRLSETDAALLDSLPL